jgi:hypothetical protein
MKRNRIPFIVGGVLIVLFAIGMVAFGGKKKSTPPPVPPESARVLSVPANRARTVVVPPCNTPVQQTSSAAAKGQTVPGATTFELPRGSGVRFVLVPHCQPKAGVTEDPGSIPSAAIVLAGGQRPTEAQGGNFSAAGANARTQLILPNGSAARTVVVPPCKNKTAGKRDVALPGNGSVVVAPGC